MTATDSNAAPGVPSGLDLPEGLITPEALDDLRRITGLQMRPERYIREATIDTLNNFCNGIGDLNPLHRDEEYAKWTRYGGLLAPGCFLYARTWPGRTRFGLPGVHGFHAGNDFRFEREIRIGDRIDSVERMLGFEEKESRFSGKLVIIHVETTFTNQRGELIATVRGWNTRHERAAARERGKESSEESVTAGGRAYDYAPEELYEIEQAQYSEDERIRGGDTRYWEDVKVGDELDAIARGPLTTSDVTAWLVGTGRGRAHGAALKEARRHPGHYFRNPDAGQGLEYTGMGHQLREVAAQVGVPGAYDFGPQRISWAGTLIENWMGDDGFLKRLRGELRGFNLMGDTTWLRGTVTRTYIEGDEALVDIEIRGENQRGRPTLPGLATVRLPSKRVPEEL